MSDFKEIAHKTVAELFDMLKEKVTEIKKLNSENDELQKRADAVEERLNLTLGCGDMMNLCDLRKALSSALKAIRGEHE